MKQHRGEVAPPGIDLRVIYRGVVPFIVIQLIGLVIIYQWQAAPK